MVVVLDQVGLEDLRAYRELLRTLPHGGLTCGFFCGREELLHWPRYDLLQLVLDTKPLYGGLENLLPAFSPADTAAAVHIGAAAQSVPRRLPRALHGDDPAGCLASLAKSAFFLLRLDHYRRCGNYAATSRARGSPELDRRIGPAGTLAPCLPGGVRPGGRCES